MLPLIAGRTQANDNLVIAFADDVRRLIAKSDVTGFSALPVLPSKNKVSDEVLESIFGPAESISNFQNIMRLPSLEFRVVGPYTREEQWPNATYTIIYYDSENSPFVSENEIPKEVGQANLYKSFLQTEVTVVDGEVRFHRVPFHLGSHHPYVGEYG